MAECVDVLRISLGVFEQFVQVEREQLENDALVVAVHKLVQQTHNVRLVLPVHVQDLLQNVDLRARLHQEGLPALDDLDRHLALVFSVVSRHHLTERTLESEATEAKHCKILCTDVN